MSDDRVCVVPDCDKPYSSKGYCKVHAERVRRNVGQPPGRPMADRLWEKVDKSGGPTACWPFTGSLDEQGYAHIRTGGAGSPTIGAHRAAFLIANPDAPAPEVIDHVCHDPRTCVSGSECPHRRCCNPAHLAASTFVENSSAERQWTRAQLTHCNRGHEYTEANTYEWVNPRGYLTRICRRCAADRARERRKAAA